MGSGDTSGALGSRGRRDGAVSQLGSATGPGTERDAATRVGTGGIGQGPEQDGVGRGGDGTESDGLGRPFGVEILLEPPRSKSQRSQDDASLGVQSETLKPAVEVQVDLDAVAWWVLGGLELLRTAGVAESEAPVRWGCSIETWKPTLPARLGCGGG